MALSPLPSSPQLVLYSRVISHHIRLCIFSSLDDLSFQSFACQIQLSLTWAFGWFEHRALDPLLSTSQGPSAFLGAVNQAGKEAYVKPLIISVEADAIEGGVHSFSLCCCWRWSAQLQPLCVHVAFPLVQEVYSFLSCLFLPGWGSCCFHCLITGNMFSLGSHGGQVFCLNMVQRVDPFKPSYTLTSL